MTDRMMDISRDHETGEEAVSRAMDAAMNYLGYGDHSAKEVLRRLEDRGFGREIAETAVDRLTDCGYIDDVRYAESYIRSGLGRNKGIGRVTYELRGKGVSSDDIAAAKAAYEELEDTDIGDTELERAVSAARKAVGGKQLDDKTWARAARRLAYLGFGGSIIHRAMQTIKDEDDQEY